MNKTELIISIISIILGSSVLNGVVTHILYNNKLKKELKNKGNDMIATEISRSLQSFRNLELRLSTIEIYNIDEELNNRGSDVNFWKGECIYPAIFNDWTSYNKFMDQIRICRQEHEKNYSCKIALNLIFIDRYIKQLSLFLSENGEESDLPFWGTVFIFDLQTWTRRIDGILVKEINKYTYKLESHYGLKYNMLRKKELIGQYDKTILHYLLSGNCPIRYRKKMKCVKELIQCYLDTKQCTH